MKENVKIAYAAYCEPENITSFNCYWCKNATESYSDVYCSGNTKGQDLFLFSIRNGNELVIAIRGSQTPKRGVTGIVNWIRDFEFTKTSWNTSDPNFQDVKVHYGFYKCYLDIKDLADVQLQYYLKNYPSKIEKITVIGHSLGASVASLYALHLLEEVSQTSELLKKVIQSGNLNIWTFGQPRTGNDEFYQYFDSLLHIEDYYRVVNQKDLVTAIPYESLGYHHLPTEYFFRDSFVEFQRCDGTGEDPNCGDSVLRDSPSDHSDYLGLPMSDGHPFQCN